MTRPMLLLIFHCLACASSPGAVALAHDAAPLVPPDRSDAPPPPHVDDLGPVLGSLRTDADLPALAAAVFDGDGLRHRRSGGPAAWRRDGG